MKITIIMISAMALFSVACLDTEVSNSQVFTPSTPVETLDEKTARHRNDIETYSRQIDVDPDESSNYKNRGDAYANLGQFEEAIQDYSQAITIDPSLSRAFYNRGRAYYNLGNYEEACLDLNEASSMGEEDATKFLVDKTDLNGCQDLSASTSDSETVTLNDEVNSSSEPESEEVIGQFSSSTVRGTRAVLVRDAFAAPNTSLLEDVYSYSNQGDLNAVAKMTEGNFPTAHSYSAGTILIFEGCHYDFNGCPYIKLREEGSDRQLIFRVEDLSVE